MKTIYPNILSLASFLFLVSCGGSGSHPKFEGVYAGSYHNGVPLTDIVLDDGSFWSLYGLSPSDDEAGVSKGQVEAKDGKFSVAFTNFAHPGDKVTTGTGAGTYGSSSAVGSITTKESGTVTFNVNKLPSQNYVYDKDADLAAIAGIWTGQLLDGENSKITINADGTFSGTSSEGCKFNGKLEPRPHGVNIFNVDANFGDTPCAFPSQTASGIALTTLRQDGKNELLFAGVLASMKAGILFSAAR